MKERGMKEILRTLVSLPFSAVVVRIPEDTPFKVETTERSRNFRKAEVKGNRVEIPTGATVKVDIPSEEIEVKDWRGREGHTLGASIKTGEEKADVDSENSRVFTPNGVEIEYRRE